MDFGTRSIRSAGLGSGSIEVTLPSPLRDLSGIACRISLRDGLRPEVVLAPDLRLARTALQGLWARLIAALGAAESPLPLAEIGIGFLPDAAHRRLAWTDGLGLSGPAPHRPDILARLIRALAAQAAPGLGIATDLAASFGAMAAFAVTGLVPLPEDQEACDIAASLLSLAAGETPEDAFAPALWSRAAAPLRGVLELSLDLTARPERLAALRRAWRQGVAAELNGD